MAEWTAGGRGTVGGGLSCGEWVLGGSICPWTLISTPHPLSLSLSASWQSHVASRLSPHIHRDGNGPLTLRFLSSWLSTPPHDPSWPLSPADSSRLRGAHGSEERRWRSRRSSTPAELQEGQCVQETELRMRWCCVVSGTQSDLRPVPPNVNTHLQIQAARRINCGASEIDLKPRARHSAAFNTQESRGWCAEEAGRPAPCRRQQVTQSEQRHPCPGSRPGSSQRLQSVPASLQSHDRKSPRAARHTGQVHVFLIDFPLHVGGGGEH
ncbi:hypothetical protein GHT09_011367 [Marmota monax]|uniref:Uncharacterized protein n=1 Tax=Marmota monax TaxID=9995 RepID=A0A834PU33_MARMO|nr:hypothetical protein GHT09_011367 [Marmota monax]